MSPRRYSVIHSLRREQRRRTTAVAGAAAQDRVEGRRTNPAERTGILTVNLLLGFAVSRVDDKGRPGRMFFRVITCNVFRMITWPGRMRKGPVSRLVR